MKISNSFRIYTKIDNIMKINSIVNDERQVIYIVSKLEEQNIEYKVIKHNIERNYDFPCTLEIKEKIKSLRR